MLAALAAWFPVVAGAEDGFNLSGGYGFVIQTVDVQKPQLQQMLQLVTAFAAKEGITWSLYNGNTPQIVLCGNRLVIERLLALMGEMSLEAVHGDLIYITASMEEATVSNDSAIGVNISNIPVGGTLSYGNSSSNQTPALSWEAQAGNMWGDPLATAKFRSGDNTDKLLLAGQVVTTNGMMGTLKNVEQVPYATVNANGSAQVNFFDADTIINITPTIVEYNHEHPEQSKIRLDVEMQLSIISSEASLVYTTTPEVNTRAVKTSRVLSADGSENIVATITRDNNVKVNQGLPVLGSIPGLKYLFSQEAIVKTRVVSWLKLAVRFVSQAKAGEEYLRSVKINQ
jgi:type II secretory pathway component GspD/PulD (secretin)